MGGEAGRKEEGGARREEGGGRVEDVGWFIEVGGESWLIVMPADRKDGTTRLIHATVT